MRKILALLLTLVMFMSLIACGVKQEKNTSQESTVMNEGNNEKTSHSEELAEIPTVTMLTFTDWYKSGWEALSAYIDEHAEELGFRLKIDIIAGGGEGEELVRAKFATGDLPDLLQTYGPKWVFLIILFRFRMWIYQSTVRTN